MAIFNSNYVLGLALSVVSFPGHTILLALALGGKFLHTGNRPYGLSSVRPGAPKKAYTVKVWSLPGGSMYCTLSLVGHLIKARCKVFLD